MFRCKLENKSKFNRACILFRVVETPKSALDFFFINHVFTYYEHCRLTYEHYFFSFLDFWEFIPFFLDVF